MGDPVIMKTEEDIPTHKPIMFLGRDLLEIKCFRSSAICGICTGVFGGLACFLATSKTLFSTHVSFASLWIGFFAYWYPCRVKYDAEQEAVGKMLKELKNSVQNSWHKSASDVEDNSDFSKQDK